MSYSAPSHLHCHTCMLSAPVWQWKFVPCTIQGRQCQVDSSGPISAAVAGLRLQQDELYRLQPGDLARHSCKVLTLAWANHLKNLLEKTVEGQCWSSQENLFHLKILKREAVNLKTRAVSFSYFNDRRNQATRRCKSPRSPGEQGRISDIKGRMRVADVKTAVGTTGIVGGLAGMFAGSLLLTIPPLGLGILGLSVASIASGGAISVIGDLTPFETFLSEQFPVQMEERTYTLGGQPCKTSFAERQLLASQLSDELRLNLSSADIAWAACADVFAKFMSDCENISEPSKLRYLLRMERKNLIWPLQQGVEMKKLQ